MTGGLMIKCIHVQRNEGLEYVSSGPYLRNEPSIASMHTLAALQPL